MSILAVTPTRSLMFSVATWATSMWMDVLVRSACKVWQHRLRSVFNFINLHLSSEYYTDTKSFWIPTTAQWPEKRHTYQANVPDQSVLHLVAVSFIEQRDPLHMYTLLFIYFILLTMEILRKRNSASHSIIIFTADIFVINFNQVPRDRCLFYFHVSVRALDF